MSRRFRNRSARHFGTGQGISPAMRRPVKRAFNNRAEQDMARENLSDSQINEVVNQFFRNSFKDDMREFAKWVDEVGESVAPDLAYIELDYISSTRFENENPDDTERALEKVFERFYNEKSRFAKRTSRTANTQAWNILRYFGKPTVKAWAKGDPNGYAVASQLEDIDFDGSIAKALREAIGYQANTRTRPSLNTERKNAMRGHNRYSRRANRKTASDYRDLSQSEFLDVAMEYALGIFNNTEAWKLVSWVRGTGDTTVEQAIESFSGLPAENYYIRRFVEELIEENLPVARMGSSRRANRRVAGVTKQDLAGITVTHKDMGGGWEFYVTRGKQGGFEWYLFDPSGELDTVRLTNSIDKAYGIAEIILENRLTSQNITDEEREQMMRDNQDYLRGLKGGSRRANRKGYKSKLDLYFSAFNRSGQMVEITAKPDGNGYIWSYQGPDYDDYDKMLISLPFEEAYNLFLREMDLTQGDFWGPEIYTHTANRRANRKRANADIIETVELGGGYSADIWFDPAGEFSGKPEYVYEVYRGGEAIAIGSTDTFDEAVYKAEFNAFNTEDYMGGGYGFDRPNYHSSRRANRKTASESMNYGDVYTVHSDGSITTETVGDMETVSVMVYEEDMNNGPGYDWDVLENELFEGVVSSIGAEPVQVGFHGHYVSPMSSPDVSDLADLGPGEYRLCPVYLSFFDVDGGDVEGDDGFDYDVVVRY